MDTPLESLLAEHTVPMDDTLSARIMANARPHGERASFWRVFADVLRPAPVAALACSLMLGLIASRHLPAQTAPLTAAKVPTLSQNAGSFLYYNGEVL